MLPHRIAPNRLGTAVVTPPPGVEGAVSPLERGFRGRLARNPAGPHQVNTVGSLDTLRVPVKPAPAIREPGTPKGPRHPAPSVGDVRRWGDIDDIARGTHGEFRPLASTPRGEQRRNSNVRGNTFRLPPKPWDADQYIGYHPAPDNT